MSEELQGETPELNPTGDGATPPPVVSDAPVESLDGLKTLVAKLRDFERTAKPQIRRLNELEQAQAQAQQTHAAALEAARVEADGLRGQLTAASEALRGYRLRDAIAETARGSEELRGVDPELAARLIEVEYGDDGKPKALTAALKALVERYPQIAAAPARVPSQPPAGGKVTARAALDDDLIAQKRRQIPAL